MKCCFRDCESPPVANTLWGPICYDHSFRLAQGAQSWYDEAIRLRAVYRRILAEYKHYETWDWYGYIRNAMETIGPADETTPERVYTALHYDGSGPLPLCDVCGRAYEAHLHDVPYTCPPEITVRSPRS